MQAQNLSQTYLLILDDVVANVKPEFVNEGVDESMLRIIRQRTEERLRQKGFITDDAREDQAGPSPDAKPPTPSPANAGVAVKQEAAEEAAAALNARKRPHDGAGPQTKLEAAVQQQDMKLGIPQQDGAADEGHLAAQEAAAALGLDPSAVTGPSVSVPGFGDLIPVLPGTLTALQQSLQQASRTVQPQAEAGAAGAGPSSSSSSSSARRRKRIPQRDGPADDDVGGEDDDGEAQAGGDDDLGSDLSDPAVAGSDEEEQNDDDITNLGFAMYEKVHRAKNRWRVHLRYGVVKINDKEYMFNKALSELLF